MLDEVRWGVIGCGDVVEHKSGPALASNAGSRLVAVMRRSAEGARQTAARHGVDRWYHDAARLIVDPEVNAIYIATPPGAHCELAVQALRAGKPVYVEKPMARSAAECQAMVAASRAAGVPLFVAYYRRALPRFIRLKQLIDSQAVGPITSIHYHHERPTLEPADPLPWRYRVAESGGGLFFDLGCHALDLLDFLFGPLDDVAGTCSGHSSRILVEDTVALSFRVGGGIVGTASWNFVGAGRVDELTIVGQCGRIRTAILADEPLRIDTAAGTSNISHADPRPVQGPLIAQVVAALRGDGECASTGQTALRTAAVMDRATEGYYGSRRGAFWEQPESWPGRS